MGLRSFGLFVPPQQAGQVENALPPERAGQVTFMN